MSDSNGKEAELKGIRFAQDAIEHDNCNDIEAALSSYREAIHYLLIAKDSGSTLPNLIDKIESYLERAEILSNILRDKDNRSQSSNPGNSIDNGLMGRAQFLLNQALEQDASGNHKFAIEMYLDAVEICLKAVSLMFLFFLVKLSLLLE